MSGRGVNGKELKFAYQWSVKVSDIPDEHLQNFDGLCSPIFNMRHENLMFAWNLLTCKCAGSIYISLVLIGARPNAGIKADSSIQLEDRAKYMAMPFSPLNINQMWQRSFLEENVKSHAVDGKVTFYLHLKIAESEFSKVQMVSGEVLELEEKAAKEFPLFGLFDKIQVQKKVQNQDPLKPEGDVHQKKLDFQIHTNNGHVIWCHSLVLISGNHKLATLVGSGLQESEQSTLRVKYESGAMMEVLHVIYRGAVSEKFHDLYLDEILDAAHDYDLPVLKLACEKQLIKQSEQFDGERCARVLELGHRYGMMEVKRRALEWASENTVKVLDSEAGKEMKESLFREILAGSDVKHAQHKNKEM